jgi:biopolymer transport protein ExbD
MSWQVRHEGSPRVVRNLTLEQIVAGLRDGLWEPTDEVLGPGETHWRPIEAHPQLAEIAFDLEPPRPMHHPEATSLDMNALIDVCLVLLIFFILTTSYANLVQKVVPMPSEIFASAKQRTATVEEVNAKMIRLQAIGDKSGKPLVRIQDQTVDVLAADGQSIDGTKLQAALVPYVRGEGHKRTLLMDAREVSWDTVVQIQDAARASGITTIHHARQK